ncbi:envelope protein [Candidatus Nitrosopelagicus brevis]|uniref:envelope protein n=1 Tax=Candidatus Nitrosopelagicus brevis TaxID=1410606 RepID=UPI0009DCB8E9|nr:envelope protein [Candidatus Nitrosopelagicus brevis]
MKYNVIFFSILLISFTPMTLANAEVFQERLEGTLDVYTNQLVFAPGEPIFVHGQAMPKEPIIIRLFTPDDTIAEFEQLMTSEDGSFHHFLMEWDKPTTNLPYGTYILEVISNQQGGISKMIEVKFSSTSEFVQVPIERNVSTIVFAPETAAVSRDFRVFVQTSSDGLLIGDDPNQILGTSHVHLPNGQVENLEDDLKILHQGLYYVDYLPALEGIYVFHMVTFDEGNISHGSGATNVLTQDISGISAQILELNQILDETKTELANLKEETSTFGSSLSDASSNLDDSVVLISDSVGNIEEGSSQLNALLFPIVASIAIILALQIVIIARRR